MWPKKSSFLSKSKKKSKKNVNLDESGHAADNDKVVPKNQETQTNPVRFVTSDVQAPPKRKSHRYRCCKKQHARDSTKSTDSQRESVSIWSCICSLLPCLCCLKAPKDDEKKSPKGSSKHCSDKGLPGSQHTDLNPRPSDATMPAAISKKSEADIGKVSAKSTVVMPMSLEDDATKPRENDKPCPCKGRPVWDEYLKPPKSKRRCRHCNKLT